MSVANFINLCGELAKNHFAIESLRDAQVTVLERIYSSPFCLATMPTGAGKTLLYALPAMAWKNDGPVLVICPLISLMRDQLRRMQEASINAIIFTADQSEEERKLSYMRLKSGNCQVIFASPERMVMPSFQKVLLNAKLSMVVVDEAHCVVSWGPGFRPEYRELGILLERLKPPRILAITATASAASRRMISDRVFPSGTLVDETVFSPLGKNIFVEVNRVFSEDEKWITLCAALEKTPFKRALVYFPRREQCEKAVIDLRKKNIHAVVYHAGLTKYQKQDVEKYVQSAALNVVVCATLAFGMGVDIPQVNLVVVFGFPANIEEYFQMIGRAGRAGEASRTLLLWSGADPKKRNFQFDATFLDPSRVDEVVRKMSSCFPASHCTRFVSFSRLKSIIGVSVKNPDRDLAAIIVALRLMDRVALSGSHENNISIVFERGVTPQQIRVALPAGITRRSLFFDAFERLLNNDWMKQSGAECVLRISLLCDETRMSEQQLLEVLDHYSSEGKFKYSFISPQDVLDGVILRGDVADARAQLQVYSKARAQFHESLRQLENLAASRNCRLAAAENFFARRVGAQSKMTHMCRQCDLCFEQLKKGKGPTGFNLFREFSAVKVLENKAEARI